jgi:4-hydroxybenzoate polyprenyltransferase
MNLRTLLVLGRVSNLPTVWSNLLVGIVLAHLETRLEVLLSVLVGGSYLYIGGMYLNDYCDSAFDTRFCPDRPVPSGAISRAAVGRFAVLWFLFGLGCLATQGPEVASFALVLIAAIVLYDFHHKGVWWAPILMGFCRFLLYPLAASAEAGYDIWPRPVNWGAVTLISLALGLYVAGITYLARGESKPGKPTRWALLLLLAPLFAAAWNAIEQPAIWPFVVVAGTLQAAWMAWLLVPLWRKTKPSIGRVVSGLLAGIVLVDILAVAPHLELRAAWFLVLFFLALLLQRFVPAT